MAHRHGRPPSISLPHATRRKRSDHEVGGRMNENLGAEGTGRARHGGDLTRRQVVQMGKALRDIARCPHTEYLLDDERQQGQLHNPPDQMSRYTAHSLIYRRPMTRHLGGYTWALSR